MSNPIAQLKAIKDDHHSGWASVAVQEENKADLMEIIGHDDAIEATSSNLAIYTRWIFVDLISKPLAAGAAVFVLLAGGWITTVSAASSSLPGDTLYNVKLVTEQTKLTFASVETRALLHTEFAQRRLDEVTELQDEVGNEELVKTTMEAFAKQVGLASDELRELQSEGSAETIKIAGLLDLEIEKLNSSIEGMTEEEETEAKVEAIEVTRVASEDLVNVMVETHENDSSDRITEGLENTFRGQYNEISQRETYLLGRIQVLRNVFLANPELATEVNFNEVTLSKRSGIITNTAARVSEALDVSASGGYRTAFEILKEINSILETSEDRVAQMEIDVIDALARIAQNKAIAESELTTESTLDSNNVDENEM